VVRVASTHAGYELVATGMLIMAAGHEGKPMDYEALERWTRVGGGTRLPADLSRCHGLVVGPQRDHEAITLIDAWLHSRLKSSHRTLRFREPLSKIDLELCDLTRHRCNPRQNITEQQRQSELVRVIKNDHVVDRQVK
jgi:hypothetical protein